MGKSFVFIFIGAALIYGIYYLVVNGKENSKRKAMIINPDDATVGEYISALKGAKGNVILRNLRIGEDRGGQVEAKLKQVQAWEIVKESPNVSQMLKDELRTLCLKYDIPIKP